MAKSLSGLSTLPMSNIVHKRTIRNKKPMSRHTFLAASVLFACIPSGVYGANVGLTYDSQTRGPVPIPPSERGLQTVVAETWFKVSQRGIVLESPAFDRNGNLLFCDVSGRRVLRVTPAKQLSTVVTLNDLSPGGLAIHKDGRIFIAAMNLARGTGSIL